jgi:hypothetical protein
VEWAISLGPQGREVYDKCIANHIAQLCEPEEASSHECADVPRAIEAARHEGVEASAAAAVGTFPGAPTWELRARRGRLAVSALEKRSLACRQIEEEMQRRLEQSRRSLDAATTTTARRTAWSTLLCVLADYRAAAKREIEAEKKYARAGGGIVDMEKIYIWQQTMRAAEDRSAKARAALGELRVKPQACSSKSVAVLFPCVAERLLNEMPGTVTFTDAAPETCDWSEAEPYLVAIGENE